MIVEVPRWSLLGTSRIRSSFPVQMQADVPGYLQIIVMETRGDAMTRSNK